jgi:hypothetical protein
VKTSETLFVNGIFSHVGAISGDFVDSNRALANPHGMSFVFSHSLGHEAPVAKAGAGTILGQSDRQIVTLRDIK